MAHQSLTLIRFSGGSFSVVNNTKLVKYNFYPIAKNKVISLFKNSKNQNYRIR